MNEPVFPDKEVLCKNCASPMAIKIGQFGKFLSCTLYPDCKTTRPLSLGVDCTKPDCSGEMVERKTKSGKPFYGCTEYPDCDFVLWNKPVAKPCPDCGVKFMIIKKITNEIAVCHDEECGFVSGTLPMSKI